MIHEPMSITYCAVLVLAIFAYALALIIFGYFVFTVIYYGVYLGQDHLYIFRAGAGLVGGVFLLAVGAGLDSLRHELND